MVYPFSWKIEDLVVSACLVLLCLTLGARAMPLVPKGLANIHASMYTRTVVMLVQGTFFGTRIKVRDGKKVSFPREGTRIDNSSRPSLASETGVFRPGNKGTCFT